MSAVEIHSRPWLLCRVGPRLCALPLESVIEITRRLPIEPLARSPPFVLGLVMLRGIATPVVDAGQLFGEDAVLAERLVSIRVGGRTVALAVTAVTGLRPIEPAAAAALPPLLGEAAADVITAIGALDAEFLHVLDAARIASDALIESAAAVEGDAS